MIVTLVAIAAWEWVDPVSQAVRARDDPSTAGAYYRPLLAELRRRDAGTARVEVPFTRDHWETVYVARRFALARGWERQLDRRLNPLFYRRQLDPAALDRWLRANAVRYVALADAPSDPAGRPEARIVAARPSFLREVWRGGHWRLYSVRDPLPLASGAVDRVQRRPPPCAYASSDPERCSCAFTGPRTGGSAPGPAASRDTVLGRCCSPGGRGRSACRLTSRWASCCAGEPDARDARLVQDPLRARRLAWRRLPITTRGGCPCEGA